MREMSKNSASEPGDVIQHGKGVAYTMGRLTRKMEFGMICDLLIIGGDGDLAFRKLYPALYHLDLDTCLPSCLRVVSVSRTPTTTSIPSTSARDRTISMFCG